jgi:GalNAc-alpha-(1->4)-GalNAc-alpha-(1->3)-diNAcBac-PP-undecaprenol alpha-1,4-N-acetyl-D-galactosaminyltransferase
MRKRFRFSRFSVLPNPIELPRNIRPFEKRQRRVINVGRLGGRKNQKALLRAFSCVEDHSDWSLHFVGDGPDLQALQDFREALGLRNNVSFLGQRSDVNDLLQDSQIFAFTSLTEGFPNALAEAMASGCACISYDCPTGPSDLIEHGVSGFLVDSGNETEYARLLQELLDKPQLRKMLSKNARRAMTRFESETVTARLEELIADTIESA